MDTAKSRRVDVAPGSVCGWRVLSSSKRKRHQSRQPCASRPAARRRRGVWRRSCRGLAGRFRHRDTLKDLPNKHMGLYRRQTFGNRARVYAQSEHCPGIARSFGLNHDLPDHRQFSSHRGQERLCRSLRQVEPMSASGQAFPAAAHRQRRAAVLPRSKGVSRSGDHRDGLA